MISGIFVSIFLSTFILEDVALASAIALVAQGKLTFLSGFFACFIGISLGDLGLYGFGFIGSRFKLNFRFLKRLANSQILTYSIVISRVIPGTRLPTYVGAGLMRYPFFQFFVLTVISVAVWVGGALSLGQSLHALLMDHWILTVLAFLIALKIIKTILPLLGNRWKRLASLHSLRKWSHFEFWPAWFFYLPIVPQYIYLSLKHRSFILPFYASPHLTNGGLIGESKWDFLKYLSPEDPTTLPSLKIKAELDFLETASLQMQAGIRYPFILKPDVGQRGFGVRIIRNEYDLTEYLLQSDFDKIMQKLSTLEKEAGIFYIRKPSEKDGFIFSITDKKFPFVTGDGKTALGDLILADARARIIASVYFSRHQRELDLVIENGERFYLSECGNHCQGAIFLNGQKMNTPALAAKIDEIAKKIPDFYFGRFDVRYQDEASLAMGKNFEIVEVNGAGSEATHIWDPSTRLSDAYRTLYEQWSMLFEIGDEVKKSHHLQNRVNLFVFFRDSAKVIWRKSTLSTSS